VLEGKATWTEIKTMTLDEVDLINIAIDSMREAEHEASQHRGR